MVGIGGKCAAIGALERERLGRIGVPRWLRGVHSALLGTWWVLGVYGVACVTEMWWHERALRGVAPEADVGK